MTTVWQDVTKIITTHTHTHAETHPTTSLVQFFHHQHIQGVPGGMDKTSGECSLG